jgi:hypothetical protein
MNALPRDKQIGVIAALCDGLGVRAVSHITSGNRGTVACLALNVGRGCAELHDRMMVGLRPSRPPSFGPIADTNPPHEIDRVSCLRCGGFLQRAQSSRTRFGRATFAQRPTTAEMLTLRVDTGIQHRTPWRFENRIDPI